MNNAATQPMATEFNSYEAVRAAGIAIDKAKAGAFKCDMLSSAELAHADAQRLWNKGEWRHARERALTSLRYTVGVLSPIYQECARRSADFRPDWAAAGLG